MPMTPKVPTLRISLLVASLLLASQSSHAINPLNDAELDARYLESVYVARAIPVVNERTLQGLSALLATVAPATDSSTLRALLSWQLQQDHGSNGKLAQAQTLFSDIMSSQLGSERYSLRWAGNLSDVLMIQPDPLQDNTIITDVLGNEVELRMSGNTAILLEVKGYRSKP